MEPNVKRHQKFSTDLFVQIEQWIALVIGIACLTIFFWSALDGYKVFSAGHPSHISAATLISAGWLVTIAIGILGVMLTRFAFRSHGKPKPDAKSRVESVGTASGDPTGNSNHFNSLALNNQRR